MRTKWSVFNSTALKAVMVGSFVTGFAVSLAVSKPQGEGNQPVQDFAGVTQGTTGDYLAARFARKHQDSDSAAHFLLQALEKTPSNLALRRDAVRQLIVSGEVEQAIILVREVPAMIHTYPLMRMVRLVEEIHRGRYQDAYNLLKSHDNEGASGIMEPLLSAWLGKPEDALSNANASAKAGGAASGNDIVQVLNAYHLALIAQMNGDNALAAKHYSAFKGQEKWLPIRMVQAYADFLNRTGEAKQREEWLTAFASAQPNNHYADVLVKRQETLATGVDDIKDGVAELFFTMASILFGDYSSEDTQFYVHLAHYLRPDFDAASMMQAQLLENIDAPEQAITYYDSIEQDSLYYARAQLRSAMSFVALERYYEAFDVLKHYQKIMPNSYDALIAEADIYRVQGEYAQAVKAYATAEKAAKKTGAVSDDRLWKLYYARGIAHERLKQWSAAEKDFYRALALQENQPDVLNYLAYSWLEQGINLEKAKIYLARAIAKQPEAAHIIDSMGWAHYMLGEYDHALNFLERATNFAPQDPTVNDHLGDVYWRLGRKIEARYQWKRALGLDPEEAQEASLKSKLADGLPAIIVPEDISGEQRAAEARAVIQGDSVTETQ